MRNESLGPCPSKDYVRFRFERYTHSTNHSFLARHTSRADHRRQCRQCRRRARPTADGSRRRARGTRVVDVARCPGREAALRASCRWRPPATKRLSIPRTTPPPRKKSRSVPKTTSYSTDRSTATRFRDGRDVRALHVHLRRVRGWLEKGGPGRIPGRPHRQRYSMARAAELNRSAPCRFGAESRRPARIERAADVRRPATNESTRARNEAPRHAWPRGGTGARAAKSARRRRRAIERARRRGAFSIRTTRASSICRVVRARARASRRRHNTRNHHRVHASRAPTGRKAPRLPTANWTAQGHRREILRVRGGEPASRRAARSRHRSSASGAVPPRARRASGPWDVIRVAVSRNPRGGVEDASGRRDAPPSGGLDGDARARRRVAREKFSRRTVARARLRRTGKRSAPLRTARAGWVTCSRSTARSEVRARSRPHA